MKGKDEAMDRGVIHSQEYTVISQDHFLIFILTSSTPLSYSYTIQYFSSICVYWYQTMQSLSMIDIVELIALAT